MLEKLYWRDVKAEIFTLNQELATVIDSINPPDDCCFYRANYRYGDEFLRSGEFILPPKDGQQMSFFSAEIPRELQFEIGYNLGNHPTYLVLKNTIEAFIEINGTAIPTYILYPGDLFGVSVVLAGPPSEELDLTPAKSIWEMTAGARSTFLLPKISDAFGHKKIEKHFNINVELPTDTFDHWRVFREIARKSNTNWSTQLLFFSRNWFKYLHTPEWEPLKLYFYKRYRELKSYWLNIFPVDVTISQIHYKKKIDPDTKVVDIIKNIFAVAGGELIGFQPAIDEKLLPINAIQEAYVNIYKKLNGYAPIIMQPAYFRKFNKSPIYTSTNMMTIENLYQLLKVPRHGQLIAEVENIFAKYLSVIESGGINIDTPYLHDVAKSVKVDFFHYLAGDKEANIKNSMDIPMGDSNFELNKFPKSAKFAHAGKFIKSCIRIAPK
ncbi:MAG: hypothetical protein K0S29_1227 [Gammaproteobacteria bacterium]|jgi:hypothetical protein|nr:hypothetical protein [Gammaproteobacteria bacterium]